MRLVRRALHAVAGRLGFDHGVSRKRVPPLLLVAATTALSGAVSAEDLGGSDPERASGTYSLHEKALERVSEASKVAPLGIDAFGDQLSLYSGSVEFSNVDISVPGNNDLPVELRRSLRIEDRRQGGYLGGFGDWDIDVPHLRGLFAEGAGWVVGSGASNQRCSTTSPPPAYYLFPSSDYWQGYWLHVPGQGDQALLHTPNSLLPAPTAGGPYPWITKSHWRLSCKPSTANGYGGQGFIAISPDGVKYHFDWVVSRQASLLKRHYVAPGYGNTIQREMVYFLVTLIEDRHGNWVSYTYSGDKLQSITSSDEARQITLTYSGSSVSSASSSVGSRSYSYLGGALRSVTRPDGSRWTYEPVSGSMFISPGTPPVASGTQPICEETEWGTGAFTYRVTHPAGAQATYVFQNRRHHRNNVPKMCVRPAPEYEYLQISNAVEGFTLLSKTILVNTGTPAQTWTYAYDIYNEGKPIAFAAECASVGLGTTYCPASKSVTVNGPGRFERHEFGILYNVNEGKLLGRYVGPNSSVVLRSQVNTYQAGGTGLGTVLTYANAVGTNPYLYGGRSSNTIDPMLTSRITQQTTTFSREYTAFDVFAHPLTVRRYNSQGHTRTDLLAYQNDLAKWVIGLPTTVTNQDTGLIESRTVYDAARLLPKDVYAFEKRQVSYTYNTDGTISQVADGRNYVTAFWNWRRGLPRNVRFPADGGAPAIEQSAAVNLAGWVTSTTDANGFTTTYTHDSMGRVDSITYPAGDSQSWTPTIQSFEMLAGGENGVPAGYWRQSVQTGQAYSATYYDGLWRPVLSRIYDSANASNTRRVVLRKFDVYGNKTFESYPRREDVTALTDSPWGTTSTYDALDRLTQSSASTELGSPAVTAITYTTLFRKIIQNPRGFSTTTTFQAFDQPSEDAPLSITDSLVNTTFTRDLFGKPLTMRRGTGAAGLRTYVYDDHQQLCKRIDPETGATIYDYDGSDNLAWYATGLSLSTQTSTALCQRENVGSAAKVVNTYDSRNRLTATTFGDGSPAISRAWTSDSKPWTVSSGISTWTYLYNKRRMLTDESLSVTGAGVSALKYEYDSRGNLNGMRYPDGGWVYYVPNALGEPTQVGSYPGTTALYADNVSFHPNGGLKGFRYGNWAIWHTTTQNERGLPKESYDHVVINDKYTYDKNGNVTEIDDRLPRVLEPGFEDVPGYDRVMDYDARDRLVSTDYANWRAKFLFDYDSRDNIARQWTPLYDGGMGRDFQYSYNAATGRLDYIQDVNFTDPAVGTHSYGYDPLSGGNRGHVTRRKIGSDFDHAYSYDLADRLKEVRNYANNQLLASYSYDGHGRRVRIIEGSQQTLQMYSQAGQIVYEKDLVSGQATEYFYLGRHLLAERVGGSSGTTRYVHTDGLGSVTGKTDSTGWKVEERIYAPYGEALHAQTRLIQWFQGPAYTGHVQDNLTRLTYAQARYYDTYFGRFLSPDPVAPSAGSFNRYWYAANNPYKNIDPDGRFPGAREFVLESKAAGVSYQPRAASDWLGPVIGGSLSAVVAAPAAGFLYGALISNPITTTSFINAVVEVGASDALGGTSLAAGSVTLFRVVDGSELESIMKLGRFAPSPNGDSVKRFLENISDAKALQRKFADFFGGEQHIVTGSASSDVMQAATRTPFTDVPGRRMESINIPSEIVGKVACTGSHIPRAGC